MNAQDIYAKLPVFLQNIACSFYGYREGKQRFSSDFFSFLKKFTGTQYFSSAEIKEYKTQQLASVLLAANKSGYYDFLEDYSCDQILASPWRVLKDAPILTKDLLRNFQISAETSVGNKEVVTSGTTGKALRFYKDESSIAAQWAVWFRHRARFGVGFKQLSVNFTGKPVVPVSQMKAPFWRYNRSQKQYLISMQHVNEKNIENIVGFLNSISPVFYSGYPSIIAEVARLAAEKGLTLSKDSTPEIVFTGAEKILDYQKDSIRSWTKSTLTDQYGLSEGCCNFSQCEYGHYHEDFEFSHIEIADPEELSDGSIRGRLIGTGFFNHAMPFIKYDTGDIAIMAPEGYRCVCGRQSQVILGVDGRVDDFVLAPDGRRVMRFDYLFKDTNEALEAQVVQLNLEEIVIRAVLLSPELSDSFEEKVNRHFEEYIATPMKLKFEYVSEIEKTSTGKFKAVVNKLSLHS